MLLVILYGYLPTDRCFDVLNMGYVDNDCHEGGKIKLHG